MSKSPEVKVTMSLDLGEIELLRHLIFTERFRKLPGTVAIADSLYDKITHAQALTEVELGVAHRA